MISLLFLLFGCESSSPLQTKQEFYRGRQLKELLYRAQVPLEWKRIEPTGELNDTRLPICSYEMEGGLLVIHTFPDQRIPPEAQTERWKKQTGDAAITPFTQGGFGGFRLESEQVLAYALQLTPLLHRALPPSELRADYTIKFMGDVNHHREEIDLFAESFEWIEPIAYETL